MLLLRRAGRHCHGAAPAQAVRALEALYVAMCNSAMCIVMDLDWALGGQKDVYTTLQRRKSFCNRISQKNCPPYNKAF